ncbi:hypothetical protein ABZ622_40780, partial [Streptomyces sp. NPDC007164]|uniref:hypothetical protein n=1 Tax=Streptomyces sp. NPDC007164 TaxID=3156918 RepID=UPI0033E16CE3
MPASAKTIRGRARRVSPGLGGGPASSTTPSRPARDRTLIGPVVLGIILLILVLLLRSLLVPVL